MARDVDGDDEKIAKEGFRLMPKLLTVPLLMLY